MLKSSYHAIERFRERGLAVVREAGGTVPAGGRAELGHMLCSLVEKAIKVGRSETVFDRSAGCSTLLVNVSGTREVVDVLSHAGLPPELLHEAALKATQLMLDDLWAVVRGDTVVTVLTHEMVQQNRAGGQFRQPDGEPFPPDSSLTHPLEAAMAFVNNDEVYAWALDFFTRTPTASLNGAMKAANNSKPRVPPVKEVFARAKRVAGEAHLKKEEELLAAKEVREKALAAKLVEEMRQKRDASKPLSKPLLTPLEANSFRGGFHQPEPPRPLTVHQPSHPLPTTEVPMAPSPLSVPTVAAEREAIKKAASTLLEVMRTYGLRSCLLTVTDDQPKPKVSWEVERRSNDSGEADL